MACPGAGKGFVDTFLRDTQIKVNIHVECDVWELVGEAYSAYATRYRKDCAGRLKRLLVDFMVGAHAYLKTDRLLTLDPRRYRSAYLELDIVP